MRKREWKRLAKDREQELIGVRSELGDMRANAKDTDFALARVWAMMPPAKEPVECLPNVLDEFMRDLVTARSCVAARDRDHAMLILNRLLERYDATN